ncbi:MAG: hypothetical protein MK101_01650 [Phycisphaerales bacterium]|nr:hypothetical protein [Phycisphaerales bacterium]
MGPTHAIWMFAGVLWQSALALAAAFDAIVTGLPAAALAVLWLAALAGPIVPVRRNWSPIKRLGMLFFAGGCGLFIGVALHMVAPGPALAAECLSFGMIAMFFAIAAALPAAISLISEDSSVGSAGTPASAT